MTKSTSKAERTKQYIIENTGPVFNTKGFAGTSLNDIIKATGLTKGSIYGNFQNKDEVALAAFDFNIDRVNQYMKTRILAKESAVERLLVYPQVYRKFFQIPFLKPGCPILNTSTEADDTHPLLRIKAVEALANWKKSIENQIMRGIDRKEIRSTTRAAEVAVIMISIIEGSIMQAKVTGKSASLKISMDFLEGYIKGLAI